MARPLAARLHLKTGRALVLNAPEGYLALLEPLPASVSLSAGPGQGPFSFVLVFILSKAEMEFAFSKLKDSFARDAVIWFAYPKKNSGLSCDLNMMNSLEVLACDGYRPVASVAVNDTWSALRYRQATEVKSSTHSNASIGDLYSEYIDTRNKTITLPPYLQELLAQHPQAEAEFNRIAYTYKKEYLMSVLTAKQEKTRLARIDKMLSALQAAALKRK